jgi:hydroxymethylbilane synthase
LLRHRPDLSIVPIRGNVNTRLRKMESGEVDALVLALCGLVRLDLSGYATEVLPREIMLPAVGQGALAIECPAADEAVRQLLKPMHDPISAACVAAERAMLAALDGSCRTPIAGFAEIDSNHLTVEGLLLNEDGSKEIRDRCEGGIDDAARIGAQLGRKLRGRASPDFGLG